MVRRDFHKAWHILYANHPFDIVRILFDKDLRHFHVEPTRDDRDPTLTREQMQHISSGEFPDRYRRYEAWRYLFRKKTRDEIVYWVNSVWVDPDYMLYIEDHLEPMSVMFKTRNRHTPPWGKPRP